MTSKNKSINFFLENFFKKKEGKSNINYLKKINLMHSGLLDSMDVILLSAEINKKFKTKIDLSDQKTLKKFESFSSLSKLISNKFK